jgi:hypothetical protein
LRRERFGGWRSKVSRSGLPLACHWVLQPSHSPLFVRPHEGRSHWLTAQALHPKVAWVGAGLSCCRSGSHPAVSSHCSNGLFDGSAPRSGGKRTSAPRIPFIRWWPFRGVGTTRPPQSLCAVEPYLGASTPVWSVGLHVRAARRPRRAIPFERRRFRRCAAACGG